jgi:hypothetical protein
VAASQTEARFSISFTKTRSEQPIDGRLLLLLSSDASAEPRMQIGESPRAQMVFGMDVEAMRPGQLVIVGDSAFGYSVRSLRHVPPGEYYAQAVLHRHETFPRADGHTVKLPMDRGEGQHWNLAPGNLYSSPRKVLLAASSGIISIVLNPELAQLPLPPSLPHHVSSQDPRAPRENRAGGRRPDLLALLSARVLADAIWELFSSSIY